MIELHDKMTPYEQGAHDYWCSLIPEDNPFSTEEDRNEWLRGYWDEDFNKLNEHMNAMHDPFMEYVSFIIFSVLLLVGVAALVKALFL